MGSANLQTPKNIDKSKHKGIKVFAPASIGNLGVGFDIMGLALQHPGDEVSVKFSAEPGLRIISISGTDRKIPLNVNENTAGVAARALLHSLGENAVGIDMQIFKKMPSGSGMGSSAVSAVAGAMAVNELLGRPYEKKDLFRFALEGEKLVSGGIQADNVAPSLLGGCVLVRDSEESDFVRVPVPRGMYAVVVCPDVKILTKDSRSKLSEHISMKSFVQQSANLGAFVLGMVNSDFGLISRSLKDIIVEPQRASMIPYFYEVQDLAIKNGALGCSISGSGPSIFALFNNSLIAEEVGSQMQNVYIKNKLKADLYVSAVNLDGAVLM